MSFTTVTWQTLSFHAKCLTPNPWICFKDFILNLSQFFLTGKGLQSVLKINSCHVFNFSVDGSADQTWKPLVVEIRWTHSTERWDLHHSFHQPTQRKRSLVLISTSSEISYSSHSQSFWWSKHHIHTYLQSHKHTFKQVKMTLTHTESLYVLHQNCVVSFIMIRWTETSLRSASFLCVYGLYFTRFCDLCEKMSW